MLEIHGQNINIYNLKRTNAESMDHPTFEVDKQSVAKVKKFPFELIENAYNVFGLFSPNFDYYLDWCHMTDNFIVIDSKTNLVMYKFGMNFLRM
jgi:hypothetical protein